MSTSTHRPAGSCREHALVLAAQHGERRAEEELLRRFEPLVRQTVRRLDLPSRCPFDDMLQEARLALTMAIRAWQPARGPFPAFAELCVRTKTATALRTACRNKHRPLNDAVSLDAPVHTDADRPYDEVAAALPGARQLADLQAASHSDPVAEVLARERLDGIRGAWFELTVRERDVLTGILNEKSYRDVAAELGCRTKGVARALHRARRKLSARQTLAVEVHRVSAH